MDILGQVMDFIFGNIWYFVAGGIAVYLVVTYLKFGTRMKIKPVSRSEVERIQFIERMKLNKPIEYKWLVHGSKVLGKIDSIKQFQIKGNPGEINVCQMVVRPAMFGHFKFANPLARQLALQFSTEHIEFDKGAGEISIPKWLTFDYYFGIYYDESKEKEHITFMKDNNLFRSDWHQGASIYYAKSQEQSTFDPEKAHELAMKEKELQIEMAKKQGKVTTI